MFRQTNIFLKPKIVTMQFRLVVSSPEERRLYAQTKENFILENDVHFYY